ncbi:hypothetical protein GGI25_004891 [Coemansia spiralis]|uniref:Uncharacterized protein n=2 Tax=Coemansia TaxID=4863 RepID=A0A9W8G3X1_9FUNG|nr:hypothetical protein BX070DRAFT_242921 [Coemansia spiralis]KAJ1990832.1 hypothetical protein EDC05_003812 [Coemansia umbellata]KAJ2622618.1 hypothetical protein GGI26_003064 [Coemansia sp. RSA 1358]KAJ2672910.1 hypothetical protein GGI25_004891 [Coemansia spiralis]
MQFSKIFVAVAAIASSALALDWTSDATLACAKSNWASIKAKADPMMGMAGAILNSEQQAALSSLLGGASTMPANPSDEFLRALPNAIPASVLDMIGGSIVESCLKTAGSSAAPTSAAPTSAAPTSAAPTSAAPTSAAPTSAAPTSAAPTTAAPTTAASSADTGATSSAPAKCVPRA